MANELLCSLLDDFWSVRWADSHLDTYCSTNIQNNSINQHCLSSYVSQCDVDTNTPYSRYMAMSNQMKINRKKTYYFDMIRKNFALKQITIDETTQFFQNY